MDNIKISKNKLVRIFLLVFILFPFIQQRTYSDLPEFYSNFYKIYSIISSTIIYAFMLLKRKHDNMIKSKEYLFVIFWSINIISTLLFAPSQIIVVIYYAYIMIALILMMFYESRNHLEDLLSALVIIYGLFIFFNWLLFMLFPNGIYKTSSYHTGHLLGDDNALIYVILPGIICIVCNSILKKNKISLFAWFMIYISEYIFFKTWSASALLCFTMFIIGLLSSKKIKSPNPMTVLVIVFMAIIIVLFGLSNPIIQNFIVNVLHKDVTLTNRTILWNAAIQYISLSPILGYGGYFVKGRFKVTSNSWYTYPSHTTYLQLLIDGGICLFFIFALITFFGFNETSKYKNNLYSRILSIGLGCMLINYITEYSQLFHFMIIISLMLNVKYAIKNEGEPDGCKRKIT